MKPRRLMMQAFGPYADKETIDFTVLKNHQLFLITGPTGSGKTTILDAMTFALYGTASGDLRENRSLRSDYASPKVKTEVQLVFTNQDRTYEVTRTPEQELVKQRGEGTRAFPAGACLVEIDDKGGTHAPCVKLRRRHKGSRSHLRLQGGPVPSAHGPSPR